LRAALWSAVARDRFVMRSIAKIKLINVKYQKLNQATHNKAVASDRTPKRCAQILTLYF